MNARLLSVSILSAAFLVPCAYAGNGAFDELLTNSDGSRYEAPHPAAAAPSSFQTSALSIAIYRDGEVRVLTKREAPKDLTVLPDDDVREDLPTGKEVLPVPDANRPGAMKFPATVNVDPGNIIPADLKAAALDYYYANKAIIGNLGYIGIVDYASHSSIARFYIADTVKGTVKVFHVAHGEGSDPDKDGYATIFSNVENSNASSLGFSLTGDIYYGKHGRSMRLHGLSATNSNIFARAVVIHSAKYVSDDNVQPGRSWGCLAVSDASISTVIDLLKGGALIYTGLSGAR